MNPSFLDRSPTRPASSSHPLARPLATRPRLATALVFGAGLLLAAANGACTANTGPATTSSGGSTPGACAATYHAVLKDVAACKSTVAVLQDLPGAVGATGTLTVGAVGTSSTTLSSSGYEIQLDSSAATADGYSFGEGIVSATHAVGPSALVYGGGALDCQAETLTFQVWKQDPSAGYPCAEETWQLTAGE